MTDQVTPLKIFLTSEVTILHPANGFKVQCSGLALSLANGFKV